MSRVKELARKGMNSLRDEGVSGLMTKTKNYLIFRAKNWRKRDGIKDILFINGCTLSHPERYRVDHQIEQLEACGMTTDKVLYTELDPEKIKFYHAVVIFRCPITDEVRKLIEKAHYFNKRVFYDIDDLVIDTKYTDGIKYVQQMSKEERAGYDNGVREMGETMKLCDYCITTTPALAKELKKYGKEVYVNRNVASEEMVKLSIKALENVRKDDKIRIGYLSGSITHNPDFEMIKPAIVKIMKEYPQVNLVLMGYLDLPEDLKRFEDRIERGSFVDWRELPKVIARLDINLAPIEESIFNAAKSENKWTEAALCRVTTVASDFGAFKEVIEDGKTGILCKTEQDWYKAFKKLIDVPELRRKIGENAYKKVIKDYITTYTGIGLAKFIQSKMAKNILFMLPSTNVSGGIIVAMQHCDILRRNGWDVTIYNQDKNEDNIKINGNEINTISGVKHDFAARFDRVVATFSLTLEDAKRYPRAGTKMYLVQNFETDFFNYGSRLRKVANATYADADGIEFITISKWCRDWLRKIFGRDAKYAPNGIDTELFKRHERKFDNKIKILIEGNSENDYKNVDEGFRIANKLDRDKYEVIYLSYGSGPKEWYKVDKFYHKIPFEKVHKIYDECDILLKTSILESFSYPPLEMMATGGYVVARPNEGNQEYLVDGENCLFYEPGNIDEAVEKIQEIADNKKLRKKLDDGAKQTVSQRNWKDIEAKIVELYQ